MSIDSQIITISDLDIEVVRKPIKNLHLAVYPPDGRIRVAVPSKTTDDNVRLAVISKLSWIKRQRSDFAKQPRQTERIYVSGETHYVWGRKYLLDVQWRYGKHEVKIRNAKNVTLFVRPGTSRENREKVFREWYREQLKAELPKLLDKWTSKSGRKPTFCGIKKMRTKWGSCSTSTGRIWLNLELAKKPRECLEYIIVHELVHLWERNHNQAFKVRLEKLMPTWRLYRDRLKAAPLAHEDWGY